MRLISSACETKLSRAFYLLGVTSLILLSTAVACGHTVNDSAATGGAGGTGGTHRQAGSPGAAGSASQPAGASGGDAGGDTATGGHAGAQTGEAGAGGAPTNLLTCQPGGAVFVVGNYVSKAGGELLLRSSATASTVALLPLGSATPSQPPQLFAVDRFCASGGAFVARDEHSSYRVDFSQSGSTVMLCLSAPVSSLDAAASLPPADLSHATDTGCAGHPFTIYTAEGL